MVDLPAILLLIIFAGIIVYGIYALFNKKEQKRLAKFHREVDEPWNRAEAEGGAYLFIIIFVIISIWAIISFIKYIFQ